MKNANKKLRWNVLSSIEYICRKTKGKKLVIPDSKEFNWKSERLKDYFGGISEIQVVILSAVLDINFSHLKIESLAKYFELPDWQYLQHNDEIEDLDLRGPPQVSITGEGHRYTAVHTVAASILRNEELHFEKEYFDSIVFTKKIAAFIEDDSLEYRRKIIKCRYFEHRFAGESFIKKIQRILKNENDRFCFYDICQDYVKDGNSNFVKTFRDAYDLHYAEKAKLILNGTHPFQKARLVELTLNGEYLRFNFDTYRKRYKNIF